METTFIATGMPIEWAVVMLCPLIVAYCVWVRRIIRKARMLRQEHFATHQPLSDEDYVKQAAIPLEGQAFAVAMRHALANDTGIPVLTIYPGDSINYFGRFNGAMGPDFWAIQMEVEKKLGLQIPRGFWDSFDIYETGIGDLARLVSQKLGSLLPLPNWAKRGKSER